MKRWVSTHTQGFTIVEMIIVIVVIAVLAALVFVGYGAVQNNAHDAAVKSDLKKIDDTFKQYALDNGGVFPHTGAQLLSLNLKLTLGSYYTNNKANVYVCTNAADTEYAVIAMSRSGKRFVVKSEQGISEYTGSVVWNATTANWPTTCSDIDASYAPISGNLTGMEYTNWFAWTGAPSVTNLFTNPSFEGNTTNVAAFANTTTFARSSVWAQAGSYSLRVTPAVASNDTAMVIEGDQYGIRNGMEPGKTYTVSGTIHLEAAQTGTLHARARTIAAYYKTPSASYVSTLSAQAPNTAGSTTRLSVTFTPPSDATEIFIRFYNGAASGGGDVYWDALMLEEGSTLHTFRDGNSQAWLWNGSTGTSTSVGPLY